MDNIIYPFQMPIYHSIIDEGSFTKIQKDVGLYIKNNKDKFKESWNCNTKTSFYEKTTPFQSFILEDQIKKHTNIYLKSWGFKVETTLKISNYWINIAEQNNFQESHHHIDSQTLNNIFSGVLYLNIPENSGNIIFTNPVFPSNLFPPNQSFPPGYKISPEEKQIIIFPSWLNHNVETNKSPTPRISLSWNIKTNE